MKNLFCGLFAGTVLLVSIVSAADRQVFGLPVEEEVGDKIVKRSVIRIKQWKKWLLVEQHGIKNSGVIWYELTLRDQAGAVSAHFPSLIGPYHLSPINHQIFACESNAMDATEHALLMDVRGKIIEKIKHIGFFRDCGTTEDKRLYWLAYSDAIENKPVTDVVVIAPRGNVIKKARLHKAGSITFMYDKRDYKLTFSEPELPG